MPVDLITGMQYERDMCRSGGGRRVDQLIDAPELRRSDGEINEGGTGGSWSSSGGSGLSPGGNPPPEDVIGTGRSAVEIDREKSALKLNKSPAAAEHPETFNRPGWLITY